MIRNVLMDLDDTILDFQKAERIALSRTLRSLGIDPAEAVLSRYHEINRGKWEQLERGELTVEQVKVQRFGRLFSEIGAGAPAEVAAERYEDLLAIGHYFIDGAEEVLQTLSKTYRLYLASNGTTKVQQSRIASAGIAKYFSGMFLSQQIGEAKPSKAFFDVCFSKIDGFQKDETVMVGDSLTSDIQGGKNAGITTIWFHPTARQEQSAVQPDYEIRTLRELPPLLARL